jgi:tRNA nucleotidyltransferase (CCA-adding enzyme)
MPKKAALVAGTRFPLPKGIRQFLQPILEKAHKSELPIYLVGGCVRDLLLGRPSDDIDLVLEGCPAPFCRAVAHTYQAKLVSHPQFLTYTLLFRNKRHLDIAAARTETYAEPACLPVVEPASLQEDLYRRDFSINAMAISLNTGDFGHIWDPYGGLEDLQTGKIRVLHAQSFRDDPTRIFRAARFAGRFGFELDWRTREWLLESVAQQEPARLSGARLREELVPLLLEEDPRQAFRLLSKWSALAFLIPSLKWQRSHDVFFGILVRRPWKGDPLLLRLLVLLHVLPFPKAIGSLGHLMFPQKLIEQIELSLGLLSRLRAGSLRSVDAHAAKRPLSPEGKSFLNQAVKLRVLLPKKEPAEQWQRYQDSAPCLTGRDVRDLGYKPGPIFTKIFEALRQARWEGKLRTREEEIRFLQAHFPINGD